MALIERNGRWFEANDINMTPVSLEAVLSTSVYIAFFRRKRASCSALSTTTVPESQAGWKQDEPVIRVNNDAEDSCCERVLCF